MLERLVTISCFKKLLHTDESVEYEYDVIKKGLMLCGRGKI